MVEMCPFCKVKVINKGLVLPFNEDGSVHNACIDSRFVIVHVE